MTYYYSINPRNINGICPICREDLSGIIVGHVKEDNNHCCEKLSHAVHKACVEPWLKILSACPTCHVSIDKSLPFRESLRDRVVKDLKVISKDLVKGCCSGALVGATIEYSGEKKVILASIIVLEVALRKILGIKDNVRISILGATLLAYLCVESAPLIPLSAGLGIIISAYFSKINS